MAQGRKRRFQQRLHERRILKSRINSKKVPIFAKREGARRCRLVRLRCRKFPAFHMKPTLPPYRSYKDLPPLAGLASMEEAFREGLSVEECVKRLKRFHYALWRLHQICIAHITAEPVYELKMAFSLHGHLAAENDTAIRSRIGEMREPPLGLEKVPHPALGVFFDEILATPSTEERLLGLYAIAFPALRDGLKRYVAETHPLADAPSRRLCRLALLDVEDYLRLRRESRGGPRFRGAAAGLEAVAPAARYLPGRGRRARRHREGRRRAGAGPPLFLAALCLRRGAEAGRPLSRSLQHGGQRRGLSLRPRKTGRAQDAHDVLQAAAGNRRPGNDGEHHHGDEGEAVGLLPRHDAPALGRGAPRP